MPVQAGIVDGVLVLPRTRIRRGRSIVSAGAFDEDCITLAAEATIQLLERTGASPKALVLATVSAPQQEGGAVQLVAELGGLGGIGLHVQEHGGTLAAAGSALVAAAALVQTGVRPVLVVASDARRDPAGLPYGDASAALLLDTEGDLGRLTHVGSASEAFPDRWRQHGEEAVSSGDDSLLPFAPIVAHQAALLGKGEDVTSITVNAPSFERAGLIGCGALPASLMLQCYTDRPTALAVSAGGITHAFRFEPGPALAATSASARTTLASGVDSTASVESLAGFDPYSSGPRAWRDRRQDLALEGARCVECGRILFPAPPACPVDGPEAKLEPWRLGRRGVVLTATRDHIFPFGGPITMCVVEIDGGGRFYGQAAGGQEAAIGDRVRLVPRLLHTGGGRPQYFWKVDPRPDVPAHSAKGGE